jgi:hypothetical protein
VLVLTIARIAAATSVAVAGIAAALAILAAAHVANIDDYPQIATYGVSVGSPAHYCYADVVNWHPSVGCETAN